MKKNTVILGMSSLLLIGILAGCSANSTGTKQQDIPSGSSSTSGSNTGSSSSTSSSKNSSTTGNGSSTGGSTSSSSSNTPVSGKN